MPLLPAEPFIFPEDLLQAAAPRTDNQRWWVLHTRARVEKALVRRLLSHQVGFFLPLYQHQWRKNGRLFSSHLPLFPGYVFLHGDERCRGQALETKLIANCLPVADQFQLVEDLARVYRLMASDSPLVPEERLRPGRLVEIISGPLAGMKGKVLRKGKQLRFIIEVQMLQQGVSLEIDHWMLQPLDSTMEETVHPFVAS
jgi:transcriptional antiterminator RfaH